MWNMKGFLSFAKNILVLVARWWGICSKMLISWNNEVKHDQIEWEVMGHMDKHTHSWKNPEKENIILDLEIYLENSGCFLMTSLSVARTAAMVSSEVPTSCWLPAGNFCTRSLIAYLPEIQMRTSYSFTILTMFLILEPS